MKAFVLAAQKRVDDKFVECWASWAVRNHMLVAIDHFELIAPTQFGRWVMEMALRLDHLVTVVACLPVAQATLPAAEQVHVRDLLPFTLDECAEYLERRFAPTELDDGLASVTHTFTDGHPGGTKLVADLINERQITDAAELRRILDRLPEDPAEQWKALVRLVLQPLHEPLLDTVDVCSVTTTFVPPLLAALLDTSDDDVRNATEILHGYGFVRRFEFDQFGPIRPPRVHPPSCRASVRAEDPKKWEELHARAVTFFATELERFEEGESGDYSAWYRYEDPYWQWCKSGWLFHSSQLRDGRELTRARFVLVFLEAFYWWGCYQPFPFNRTLLYEWAAYGTSTT